MITNLTNILSCYQMSVSTEGLLGHELSKASLSFNIDSPVSQEIHFLAQIVKKESDHASNLDFKVLDYFL